MGFAPGIDDYGPLWVQPIESIADGFPYPPLDAISHHRLTDRTGDSEANSWPVGLRLADTKSGEQRPGIPGPAIVYSSKILGAQQTDTFRKSRDGELPLGTYSEFLASACTPASQHGAPVLRFHAAAEAVRLGAMTIIRLKGAFRHFGSNAIIIHAGNPEQMAGRRMNVPEEPCGLTADCRRLLQHGKQQTNNH